MIIITELLLGVMAYIDYYVYKKIATPTIILGGVYLLIIPMINTFGQSVGFLPIEDETMIWFTLFMFVLFVSGLPFTWYYNRCGDNKRESSIIIENKLLGKETIIWRLFAVSLLCYVISLIQVIQIYGIHDTKSHAFGPFAHLGFLSRCLLPIIIYFFIKTRKIRYLIATVINIIALILFQGKYHLFIPIAGFIVLYLITAEHISVIKIIGVVVGAMICGLVLFLSIYTIIPNIAAGHTTWEDMAVGISYSTRHFFSYLFCPLICSNTYFSTPVYRTLIEGMRTNFNGIDVLIEQIIGNRDFFSPIITLWPEIDNAGGYANVGGLFSESVLNIGYPLTIIYVGVIGLITYYFITRCLLHGKRIVTTICMLGTMMMCFFCNYFSLFANIECLVYCFLFDTIFLDDSVPLKLTFIKKRGLLTD